VSACRGHRCRRTDDATTHLWGPGSFRKRSQVGERAKLVSDLAALMLCVHAASQRQEGPPAVSTVKVREEESNSHHFCGTSFEVRPVMSFTTTCTPYYSKHIKRGFPS
jgi:hypothetical protein